MAGGAGANGQIKITPYASQPFKTLIAHRPPLGALKTFQPLVSVGGGNDVPNGATQYSMPQPLTGVNGDFGGTYTDLPGQLLLVGHRQQDNLHHRHAVRVRGRGQLQREHPAGHR